MTRSVQIAYRSPPRIGASLGLGLVLLAAGPRAIAGDAAETLNHVRQALGYAKLADSRQELLLTGAAKFIGLDEKYSLRIDPQGRFVAEFSGRIEQTMGYDGKIAWELDWNGISREMEFGDRDNALTLGWLLTDYWLSDRVPLRFELDDAKSSEQSVLLSMKLDDSPLSGTIEIDRQTWLPRECNFSSGVRNQIVRFKDFAEHGGAKLPARIEHSTAPDFWHSYSIDSIAAAPPAAGNPFAQRPTNPAAVRFDKSAAERIETKRAPTGHLLVHPLVDGKDIGWFIFDTGAGNGAIDKETAEKAGYESFGNIPVVGAGGTIAGSFCRTKSLQLGPAIVDQPVFAEINLSTLSPYMGVPVAGVIGYSLLAHVVAEINMSDAEISIRNPAEFKLKGAEWTQLALYNKLPSVRAKFESHEGAFRLDTGAGHLSVAFHAPAVERFSLLDGRETTATMLAGVGGGIPAKSGRLKSFELAGERSEDLNATFATKDMGAFADRYCAGTIGGKFLAPFTVVLDYSHRRIALVKKATTTEATAVK